MGQKGVESKTDEAAQEGTEAVHQGINDIRGAPNALLDQFKESTVDRAEQSGQENGLDGVSLSEDR